MRKVFAFFFALILMFTTVVGLSQVGLARANPFCLQDLPMITINADGNITGNNTDFTRRDGRTYTLTADIEDYVLRIKCNNIILDGNGHRINATNGDNAGLQLIEVASVTVKNLEIISCFNSIYLSGSRNCLITNIKINNRIYLTSESNSNTITNSDIKRLTLSSGSNDNYISKNNIKELFVFGSNNKFCQNNFLLEEYPTISSNAFWDNGYVGNYWKNYSMKYPNASEIDNAGIGDTWYAIERDSYSIKQYPANCIDHYPLMYPWGSPEIASLEEENTTYTQNYPLIFTVNKPVKRMSYSLDGEANITLSGNITINGLAIGTHNLTIYATDNFGISGASKTIYFTVDKPFPTVLVAGICAVSGVGVAVCLFYLKKKRSHQS